MRKLFCFITSVIFTIFCISVCCPAALAAAVSIHNGGGPGVNNLSGSEYVSDLAESGGKLYFMVRDRETGYQTKLICTDVKDAENAAVYTPKDMAESSGRLYFVSMEPAASGGLWIHLESGPELNADRRVVLFRDGKATARQSCAGRAKLCAEGAVWKDESEFVCWDGTQATRYPIPVALDTLGGFVLWNGKPCFEDWSNGGRVLTCQADGQTTELFSLPEGTQFDKTSLFACDGKLYLSYRTDAGGTRTTCISDGKHLSEKFYPADRVRVQPDGFIQIMAAESLTNIIRFTQVSISQEGVTERPVGEYLVKADVKMDEFGADGLPVGWRFTDSEGNQWIYAGEVDRTAAVTKAEKAAKVTADGTTVSYTSESLSGFALYHKGAGVSFDVEPYITDTGFTMVPVRGVAYLLNADISWDGDTQTVTVKQGEHEILLTIGSMTALVDGAEVPLGTPAAIVGGRTMLPLRFLTETLGGTVRWEDGAVYID